MAERSWLTITPDTTRKMRSRIAAAERGRAKTPNDGRIAALKNKHAGRVGWLIGNGPSVRLTDLERLNDEVTFCCNRFYLAYDQTDFRPTYLCSTDKQMIRDFGQEMVDAHPGEVLLVTEQPPTICGEYTWFPFKSRTPLEFSENVYDFVMPGGGTLISAIQIGYHMGIRKFCLYGVDHSFDYRANDAATDVWERAQGDDNHFIPNYRSGKPWSPPVLWQVEGALLSSLVFLQSKGGWVKNATRGGKLEVLERVNFDAIAPGVGVADG